MEYVMLKEVCAINMGQSPDSNSYNEVEEGLPFFQGNADFGERYPIARKWCTAPNKIALAEDILISVRAPIGAINFAYEECCIGRGLAALTPDKSKIVPDFLFWFLKHINVELNDKGTGSTFKAIGRKAIEEIKLPNIPLKTQQEISIILGKIHSVIQTRKQEMCKLDDLIKARFVELFGDIISNEKGWETDLWSNVLTIVNGKNQKAVEAEDGEYLICGSGGAMGKANDYLVNENSVIVGRKGNINKPILMREKYWNVDTAFGIEPNEEFINVDYFYMFCIFFNFEKLNKAVTIPSLTKSDLLNIEMPVPDKDIQKQFTDFVAQVDKSKLIDKKLLQKKLKEYRVSRNYA